MGDAIDDFTYQITSILPSIERSSWITNRERRPLQTTRRSKRTLQDERNYRKENTRRKGKRKPAEIILVINILSFNYQVYLSPNF